MSGFAGVFHLDGAPVDPSWLAKMADFLKFRGPDASQVWTSGSAGLCHTLLRTRAEHDNRPQIISLDGNSWIAGDVRIDDRETLFAKLPVPAEVLKQASSAELILHAYAKWGEACVEHLIGDFSFVIWDANRRRVFCARDQLGLKLLFYAQIGNCLVVSNTQHCVRQLSIVPDELNGQAIGDFLLIGTNYNPTTTFFTAVRRLPAAHRLIASPNQLLTERYWSPPIDEPVYYKRASDYPEHFLELLRTVVRDRIPDGPLGIFMSGGLDSPAIAAMATRLGAKPEAVTWVFDELVPDEERHYSGLVAEHLNIPIHYHVQDQEPWGLNADLDPIRTLEPSGNPLSLPASEKFVANVSERARVFFFGAGPDASLQYEWKPHLQYLAGQHRWGRLCRDIGFHVRSHRRFPLLPTIPRIWREKRDRGLVSYEPGFPNWINPEFARHLKLRDRIETVLNEHPSPHPIRPRAYLNFGNDFPMCGSDNDWGLGGARVETTQPFGDLRMLRFLMSVPALPWARDKYLIRISLKGILPEAVRLRPKSPVHGFPYQLRCATMDKPSLPEHPVFSHYVDTTKVPIWPGRDREELDGLLRVLGFNYWLLGERPTLMPDSFKYDSSMLSACQ